MIAPGRALAWGGSVSLGIEIFLPTTLLARWLGFTPLPPLFFGFLIVMIVTYLWLVEVVKGWFSRQYLV